MVDRTKRFWALMNSQVSVDTLSSLLGLPRGRDRGAHDTHADEVLELAAQEARRRGKRIEDVLAEMGFEVEPELGAHRGDQRDKSNLLAALQWSAPVPELAEDDDARFTDPPLPAGSVERLRELFPDLAAEELDPILAALSPSVGGVSEKLRVLRAASPERLARAAADAGDTLAWWEALIHHGVAPELLAEVLRTEPGVPPRAASPELGSFREHLLDAGALSWPDAKAAVKLAAGRGGSYLTAAVDAGTLQTEALFEAIVAYAGATPLGAVGAEPDDAWLSRFPVGWVRAFGSVPVAIEGETVVVAAAFPLAGVLLARLEGAIGAPVVARLARPAELEALCRRHLDRHAALRPEGTPSTLPMVSSDGRHEAELRAAITRQSAVEVVRKLVEGALAARATDIHLEPVGDAGRVRYRIDGILHEVLRFGRDLHEEVIARMKILADLDITERRRPQDGHISIEIHDKPYDLRIATVPARGGEKLAVRVADAGRGIVSLEQLGMAETQLQLFRRLIERPYGMVLATGPVGSGKSTTLYACLSAMDRKVRQVVSIEDPVEVQIEDVNQVEVNYRIGFDFVVGLRALLRQDPDAILVGEIRDDETAKIAVRASMTGLMVFSTLHTNDAVGAITALRNFNMPSHLVASALQGVIAQRLLRKLCEDCRSISRSKRQAQDMLGVDDLPKGFRHYVGKGCPACMNTGYVGRTGVFELLAVDRSIRDMILEEAAERTVREYALEHGMVTLQQDALEKVQKGITSAEEYRRVLRF
jgi:type IV pilus assembly protein PilB